MRAAEALRTAGFAGQLTLVGAERHLPYQRPPLSKQVLAGAWEPERARLRTAAELTSVGLDLRLGQPARRLDLDRRTVMLHDGTPLPFDGLLVATGAVPRTLRQLPSLDGVHLLRTLDDCLALRGSLTARPRVAVIGAGFIGAEVAATARQLGAEVTLIEALPTPLLRALGPQMGAACAALHTGHGVRLRCGVPVAGLAGHHRVEEVRLADGSRVAADVVVIGVGVAPATDWLADSGLPLDDGVVVDQCCASPVPGVFAAGDVARWVNPRFGHQMRVEHWTNAAEQSVVAARNMLADPAERRPFDPVPFFWSDQYGLRIQLAGDVRPDDPVEVVEGSVDSGRWVALYRRDDRLVGVLGCNCPVRVAGDRQLITAGSSWTDARDRVSGAPAG